MTERVPAEVFPPGELIRDEIEARGWTQAEFAEVLGRPGRLVSELIAGKRGITPETAKALGEAFGTGAQFWMNLEAAYQLSRVKIDATNAVARRSRLYACAPVKEMIRRNWIKPTENIDVLETSFCDFFDKRSVDAKASMLAHAARKSSSYEEVTASELAWLYRVRQIAETMTVRPFSEISFSAALGKLKTLFRDAKGVKSIPSILADAGVRFLIVEALPSTRIDGVCLWLNQESPVIALSLRFDRIDAFWFTLLHECAHVKQKDGLHGETIVDVDLVSEDDEPVINKPEKERRADEFAAEFIIPAKELRGFIVRVKPLFSKVRIQGLAARLNVHPGLVVGQLQHKRVIPYSHSREMLVKVRTILIENAPTDGFGSILSLSH